MSSLAVVVQWALCMTVSRDLVNHREMERA